MKKLLILVVLLAVRSPLHSQLMAEHGPDELTATSRGGELAFYFGGGYGVMFPSGKGIDDFVSEYNKQRSKILSKELSTSLMSGWNYHFGMVTSGIMVELGHSSRSGTMTAEADPAKVSPGDATKRDIKLIFSAWNIGAALLFGEAPVGLGPFLDFSFISLDYETTTNTSSTKSYELGGYAGMNAGLMLSAMPAGNLGALLTIKGYYSFSLSEPDWRKLYTNTGTVDPASASYNWSSGGFGGLGVSVTLSLAMGCL